MGAAGYQQRIRVASFHPGGQLPGQMVIDAIGREAVNAETVWNLLGQIVQRYGTEVQQPDTIAVTGKDCGQVEKAERWFQAVVIQGRARRVHQASGRLDRLFPEKLNHGTLFFIHIMVKKISSIFEMSTF
jgi:hypothetical protein